MINIKKNNQLQSFLTEYTKGNVLIADNGAIEEIEQSNQHFTLTITHEVLTSDIVQFITFKQHENYTQGSEYNELSDVFDYDNVFSVTLADGEVVEVKEKTNEKAENNMTNTQLEYNNIIGKEFGIKVEQLIKHFGNTRFNKIKIVDGDYPTLYSNEGGVLLDGESITVNSYSKECKTITIENEYGEKFKLTVEEFDHCVYMV